MVKEELKVIAQYYELHAFLWQEPRTKEQIAKYVVDGYVLCDFSEEV